MLFFMRPRAQKKMDVTRLVFFDAGGPLVFHYNHCDKIHELSNDVTHTFSVNKCNIIKNREKNFVGFITYVF